MSCCKNLIKAIDQYILKVDNDLAAELEAAGYLDALDDITFLEEELAAALIRENEYYREQINQAVDIHEFADRISEIIDNNQTGSALSQLFRAAFLEEIPKRADIYMKAVDPQLTVSRISDRAVEWADDWSVEVGHIMEQTKADKIQELLRKTLDAGNGIDEFTADLLDSDFYDVYYRARAAALTETLTAHAIAAQEAYMQNPAVVDKLWRHSGTYKIKPRDNHVAIDGQRVPKAERFNLTGRDGGNYMPLIPRDTDLPPEERINCHCFMQPVVDDEILGLSLEERERLQQEAIDDDNGRFAEGENNPAHGSGGGLTTGLGSGIIGYTDGNTTVDSVRDIDFNDGAAVDREINGFLDRFAYAEVEHSIVITKSGKLYEFTGTKSTVNPAVIFDKEFGGNVAPDELVGSVGAHNHPVPLGLEKGDSFSLHDLNFSANFKTGVEYLASGTRRDSFLYTGDLTGGWLSAAHKDARKKVESRLYPSKGDTLDNIQADTMRELSKTLEGLIFNENI